MSSPAKTTPTQVRSALVDALQLDLIGPSDDPAYPLGNRYEILNQTPSRWYLTGFLVPADALIEDRTDPGADEDVDSGESGGFDDDQPTERAAARNRILPSSMGLSVILPPGTKQLRVEATWGDYKPAEDPGSNWVRTPQASARDLDLPPGDTASTATEYSLPNSQGLKIALAVRSILNPPPDSGIPVGARTVSVFLVNRRTPTPDIVRDKAHIYQARLSLQVKTAFLSRPDLRGLTSEDKDEQLADLQYRDLGEFAVGHNVATRAICNESHCHRVETVWLPQSEVERVAPSDVAGVELSMDVLGEDVPAAALQARLNPMVTAYRAWIDWQRAVLGSLSLRRQDTASRLLQRADEVAAERIARGIALLADTQCRLAFVTANRAMAQAARQRFGVMQKVDPATIQPAWRLFQLAFILMNLPGIANPRSDEREVVDLLFFPTGGGKTEAYLGLAAFTMLLRRLKNTGICGAGVSVLMRYTLRLLTLDQLGRASTLICALELTRQQSVDLWGEWPFEIGLWVGRAATPNRMGGVGIRDDESARKRTNDYLNDSTKPSPIPIESCPWCGQKFSQNSFRLLPDKKNPTDLRLACMNPACAFSRGKYLPMVTVDEPLYRRLPCFIIATVDKFAGLPWFGDTGALFGRVDRYDPMFGFFGPMDPGLGAPIPGGRLQPPDLIVQDELHLISGPLGTMAGLYETTIEELCLRQIDGVNVRPKIIASTATVRRAERQIRALFNRRTVDVFPPPGPDRRDSFFAHTQSPEQSPARLYLGVAAQGRSPKLIMLRVYQTLLSAGQFEFAGAGGAGNPKNPADPYMTLVGYFNSLRELGGARRIVEDELRNGLLGYSKRCRVGQPPDGLADRTIDYDPVELTSRESTAKVSQAKRKLERSFNEDEPVHVAIATNMISVGLDIPRLGLMGVFGQPKTTAEYIQATSRVGREREKPGLVVTLFNIHKPRDRSHYERFAYYHESFYRSVEASSVTPFSPRALDKGLAGALVGLSRHGLPAMTAPGSASEIVKYTSQLDPAVEAFANRAMRQSDLPAVEAAALRDQVRARGRDLMNQWANEELDLEKANTRLKYAQETAVGRPLIRDFLDKEVTPLPPGHRWRKFRAGRSLRDVELASAIFVRTLENVILEDEE